MPLYNFATYASVREEWAIRADNLAQARKLIGDDPSGNWLDHAFHLDAEPVERRDEFVLDDEDAPAVEEITPDHWGWRSANADAITRSLHQNVAAIAAEFHTHRLCDPFYARFVDHVNGFTGLFDLCVSLAEALTAWETANGMGEAYERAGVAWIETVEDFTETFLETALDDDALPNPAQLLPGIQVFRHLKRTGEAS